MHLKSLALLVLSAFGAGTGVAADSRAPVPKAPPVAAYDWSGAYVGAHAGYAFGVSRWEQNKLALDFLSSRGFTAGLLAGYNLMLSPRLMAGLEGDVSWPDVEHRIVTPDLGGGEIATLKLAQTSAYSLRARLGVLITPQTLLYGTGGWARTRSEYSFESPATPFFESSTQWVSGLQAGAGVEARLGGPWRARLEYLHTFYRAHTVSSSVLGTFDSTPSVGVGRLALVSHLGPQTAGVPVWTAASPTPSWSGIYVGAAIGPGAGSTKVESVAVAGVPAPGLTIDGMGVTGIAAAGLVGVNLRVTDRVVAGVESEALPGISATDFKLGATVAVRGRVGYLVTPANLVFLTGGWLTTGVRTTDLANGRIVVPSQRVNALQVGAGLESAITNHWLARFDYQFASARALDDIVATIGGVPTTFQARPQWHYGEVALVYLFDGR